jgi:hypothetical protein
MIRPKRNIFIFGLKKNVLSNPIFFLAMEHSYYLFVAIGD